MRMGVKDTLSSSSSSYEIDDEEEPCSNTLKSTQHLTGQIPIAANKTCAGAGSSGFPLRLQHLSAATGLIATYLIEIGVQIFVICHCWDSLVGWSWGWDWSSFFILSSVLTSFLVTTMSIVWVCRGLDFVGRVCARLLCYVMHFCLLGLVWRYLKLAFAYDHADVQEFVALRIFQVFIQSLPLTSIHLAWLLTFREEWFNLAFWTVLLEIGSVGICLIISAYIKSEPSAPSSKEPLDYSERKIPEKTTQVFSDSLKCSVIGGETGVNWSQVLSIELNIVSRLMLLVCRLLVAAILIANLKFWSIPGIFIHFLLSFGWIGCSDKRRLEDNDAHAQISANDEENRNTNAHAHAHLSPRSLIQMMVSSYIIFWDLTSSLQGPIRLSAWSLPAILVIFENGATIFLYSIQAQDSQLFITLICTVCLLLGMGLFSLFNLTNFSHWCDLDFGVSKNHVRFCTKVSSVDNNGRDVEICCSARALANTYEDNKCWRECEDLDPDLKNPAPKSGLSSKSMEISVTNDSQGSWDLDKGHFGLDGGKPLIMANNYTNISAMLVAPRVKGSSLQRGNEQGHVNVTKGPPEASARRPSPPTSRDSPPTSGTWVPDTCCNDSNGSSHSRNTNTLLESIKENHPAIPAITTTNEDGDLDPNPHFVFYFPEQRTHRHHSVVRKLNVQIPSGGKISPPTTGIGKSKRQSRSRSNSTTHSINSSSGTIRVRTSTPVEIKEAARVIMNYPKHYHLPTTTMTTTRSRPRGSRCHCHTHTHPTKALEGIDPPSDPFYEKLMEDSYGILICEGEVQNSRQSHSHTTRPVQPLPSIFHVNQKLKVLCAKCLRNHDPLLTNCMEEAEVKGHAHAGQGQFLSRLEPRAMITPRVPSHPSTVMHLNAQPVHVPYGVRARACAAAASDTTEYPSETEMTWTAAGDDQLSVSSHLSAATYTTWPRPRKTPHMTMSMWTTSSATRGPNPKEFTSREYVRAWLLTSAARAKHYYNENEDSGNFKRVHRSRTISTGTTGGAGSHCHSQKGRIGSTHQHRNLGKRHGPVGRGQSPEIHDTMSRSLVLTLTPPPKHKQHPTLSSKGFGGCASHHRANECKQRERHLQAKIRTKEFYKDLEIVV